MAPDWLSTASFVEGLIGIAITILLGVGIFVLQQRDKINQIARDISEIKIQMTRMAETSSTQAFAHFGRLVEMSERLADRASAAGQLDKATVFRDVVPDLIVASAEKPEAEKPEQAVPDRPVTSPRPSMEELIDIAVRLPPELRRALTLMRQGGPFDPARRVLYGPDGTEYPLDPAQVAPLIDSGFLRRSPSSNDPLFANDVVVPPATAAALRLVAMLYPV